MLVSKSKAEYDGVDIEVLQEQGVYRDSSSGAGLVGLPAIEIVQDSTGDTETWVSGRDQIWRCPSPHLGGCHLDSCRCYCVHVIHKQIGDSRGILVCYQSAGDFGMSRAGEHRFHTLPLKAAVYSVYLQGWSSPGALIAGKSRLTEQTLCPGFLKVCSLVNGDRGQAPPRR
jgi:hypothetical protein